MGSANAENDANAASVVTLQKKRCDVVSSEMSTSLSSWKSMVDTGAKWPLKVPTDLLPTGSVCVCVTVCVITHTHTHTHIHTHGLGYISLG